MTRLDADGFCVPTAVIVLVVCTAVGIMAGQAGNTGLRTAAVVMGGVIAVGLVVRKVVSIRNR